jgi:PAS domain S-box-containing protein
MKPSTRSVLVRYSLAVLFSLIAIALTLITPLNQGARFLLGTVAVILAARYGGLGPGLFAGVFNILVLAYYLIAPIESSKIGEFNDWFQVAVYAILVLLLSRLIAGRERVKERARIQAYQQAVVAQLGQSALASDNPTHLLDQAARIVCSTFNTEFAQVLEFLPEHKRFAFRATHGWDADVSATIVDMSTPAGYVVTHKIPVVIQDARTDDRFQLPRHLYDHQVISGIVVYIAGTPQPFGVLATFSKSLRAFSDDDIHFLQAVANVLAAAIERGRVEQQRNEQREWLRTSLSSIGDGVIVTDQQGRVSFINAVAQKLTGWLYTDAVQQPVEQVFKLVDDKTGQVLEHPVVHALADGKTRRLQGYRSLMRRDGKLLSIDDSAAPMKDSAGKIIGAVLVFRDMTVQRRIELVVRQSEERFRVALKNSPFGVYNQDRDLRYTWIYNPTGGFPRPGDINKTDQDLLPPTDAARLTELKRNVLESGAGAREEITVTINGQRRVLDLTIEPLRDADGTVIGITGASFDVTERKRELASLARLAAVVESSSDAIVSKTLDGIVLSWNPGAERLYGYTADEMIGQSISILYPSDRRDEFRDVLMRVKDGQLVEEYDTVRVRKDGARIDVSVSVSPVRDTMGRVVAASTIAHDIAQRKRDEEALRQQAQLLDLSSEAIFAWELDGGIVYWNKGAERLYGYRRDQVLGQVSHTLLGAFHPEGMNAFIATLERDGEWRGELTHRTQDGRIVTIESNQQLVVQGGRKFVLETNRDITERKRQEELALFRAQAADVLAASLDYETTLANIARFAVPRIADWCSVHILGEDGELRELAIAHVDPAQIEHVRELRRRYPPVPNAETGLMQVVRTGRPLFVPEITEAQIRAAARDEEHLAILQNLQMRSAIVVPLTAHQRTFGALAFVLTGAPRFYTQADVESLQELANSAALAVDNARLYRDLQQANDQLEQRVARRTLQLQQANQKLQDEIAERKRTTDQLHQLSAHLQSAREEERTRIAREIHDHFGQVLTAVKMDLAALARKLSNRAAPVPRDELLDQIQITNALVDDSVKKMRELIYELRPEILDQLGLKAAIEWQCQEFQKRTGIQCTLEDAVPDEPLDIERATAVFRILQETFTNILRHANATQVKVILRKQGNELLLQVQDNGRGITENEIVNSKSFGILGMRERALIFGGQVNWQGFAGKGTTVTVQVPLNNTQP